MRDVARVSEKESMRHVDQESTAESESDHAEIVREVVGVKEKERI